MKIKFNKWSKKEVEEMLRESFRANNKLKVWLYQNHKEVLRQYENEELDGMHLELLDSDKSRETKE